MPPRQTTRELLREALPSVASIEVMYEAVRGLSIEAYHVMTVLKTISTFLDKELWGKERIELMRKTYALTRLSLVVHHAY